MFKKALSPVMLVCTLFSGHLLATHNGHLFLVTHNPDRQLQHEGDSDELRSATEEAATNLRERRHGRRSQHHRDFIR